MVGVAATLPPSAAATGERGTLLCLAAAASNCFSKKIFFGYDEWYSPVCSMPPFWSIIDI